LPASLTRIFAARVREVAAAKGLSINKLADFSGLSRGFVSEVLRGAKVPSLVTVEQLAAALDVEPWELLRDERSTARTAGA
jgi:transcriptional regulator with XRE-family HTH domain